MRMRRAGCGVQQGHEGARQGQEKGKKLAMHDNNRKLQWSSAVGSRDHCQEGDTVACPPDAPDCLCSRCTSRCMLLQNLWAQAPPACSQAARRLQLDTVADVAARPFSLVVSYHAS